MCKKKKSAPVVSRLIGYLGSAKNFLNHLAVSEIRAGPKCAKAETNICDIDLYLGYGSTLVPSRTHTDIR